MTPATTPPQLSRLEILPTRGFGKRLARFISGTATKHFEDLTLTAGMTGAAVMTIHERPSFNQVRRHFRLPQASTPKERGPRPV
jgi:hypothetical protein